MSNGKVDFDSVRKNILKEDLDINLIGIFYEKLTEKEFKELKLKQNARDLGNGKALANYPLDFDPLYQDKAVGIHYLGA